MVAPNLKIEGDLVAVLDGQQWLAETANKARNILNIGMRDGPQTGRVYVRGNIRHRASAPGQWPAVDTGQLRIRTKIRVSQTDAELGSNLSYAKWLQNGTRRMKPRKLFSEAMEMAVQETIDLLPNALKIVVIKVDDD